jgi:hypothetical protein
MQHRSCPHRGHSDANRIVVRHPGQIVMASCTPCSVEVEAFHVSHQASNRADSLVPRMAANPAHRMFIVYAVFIGWLKWWSERAHLEGATISVRWSLHGGHQRANSSSSGACQDISESRRRCTCVTLPRQAMDLTVSELIISRFMSLHRDVDSRYVSGGFVLDKLFGFAGQFQSRNFEGGVSARVLLHAMFLIPTGRRRCAGRLLQMTPRPASQPSQARACPLTGKGLSLVSLAKSVR